VADALNARLAIHLIGERPGGDAHASRSLSAYLVYRTAPPGVSPSPSGPHQNPSARFEVTVVSNIHDKGLPPVEAGAILVERAAAILQHGAAGNRLEAILANRVTAVS
jgi:ethanolamine ammonia-lyase large subunit